MVSIVLIIINVVVSYRGFKSPEFVDKYALDVEAVRTRRDYKRLVTSGFLHANWRHLFFNMLALFLFGPALEGGVGMLAFAILYLGSLIGADLFSLFIHRNKSAHSSIGASGAVSGVIFAGVALIPGFRLSFLFLPFISIPGWLFALGYIIVSVYGIRNSLGKIDHAAHMGGGVCGMVIAVLLIPSSILTNYFPIVVVLLPALAIMLFIWRKPHLFYGWTSRKGQENLYHIDDRYNAKKKNQENELNTLLEKIAKSGFDSLSKNEKARLDELSRDKF